MKLVIAKNRNKSNLKWEWKTASLLHLGFELHEESIVS